MLVDETPLISWDIDGNPDRDQISCDGCIVWSPQLRSDYVSVVTQEPMRNGMHYIQFVMHQIEDEQWCGVVTDKSQAGSRVDGRSIRGWLYYCGRQGRRGGTIHNGLGALHVQGMAVQEFAKPRCSGD